VTGALCMPVFIKSGRRPSPLLELVDPEIVWDMSAIEIPDLGVFHGHDGAITFWLKWLAEWEDYSFETDRFEEVGDHVVFDVVLRGKSRWIGAYGEQRQAHVATLRAGKLVAYRVFKNRSDACRDLRGATAGCRAKEQRPPSRDERATSFFRRHPDSCVRMDRVGAGEGTQRVHLIHLSQLARLGAQGGEEAAPARLALDEGSSSFRHRSWNLRSCHSQRGRRTRIGYRHSRRPGRNHRFLRMVRLEGAGSYTRRAEGGLAAAVITDCHSIWSTI
jgi:ketosteroid isomerase-like protein